MLMTLSTQGVTIVLCCYNSAKRLPVTLGYLKDQTVPVWINWEVLIIDNLSDDGTKKIASEIWKSFNISTELRIIEEPIPGLSNARNKGIETARYSYILFCDDDNWLDPNYVARGFNIMVNDERIGVVGGLAFAAPEPPVPAWFPKRISHFSVGSQEKFAADNWVYGAGSICRRDALMKLEELQWKQITSDRLGDELLYGGDNEICYMLKLMGYYIVYKEELQFQHFIPQSRMTEAYIEKSAYGSYLSTIFLYPYFYYLNKRWKHKSLIGYILFALFYCSKEILISIIKYLFPINMDSYNKKMNSIKLKAVLKAKFGGVKTIKQFILIHSILKQL